MCVDLREWENRYHVLRERAGGGSVFGSAGVGAVGVLLFVVVVVLFMLGGGGGIRKKKTFGVGVLGIRLPKLVFSFFFSFSFFSLLFSFFFFGRRKGRGKAVEGKGLVAQGKQGLIVDGFADTGRKCSGSARGGGRREGGGR